MRSGTVLKMLCPFYSAGAIIGDGGKEIKNIKESYGISIQVSKKEVRFPGTDERVITMQGECDTIKKVVKHIQDLIRNDKPPPSAKSVDVEGNEKRKRALKLVVADTSAGRLIGKGGETIKQTKEKFQVTVNTSKKHEAIPGLDERIISVEGDSSDEVDGCVEEMIETVCGDRQARMQWFVDYNNIGSGFDDGRSGYGDRAGGYGGYSSGGGGGYGRSSYGGQSRSSGYSSGGGYGSGYSDSGYGSRGGYDDRSSGYGGYGPAQDGYSGGRYGGSGSYGRR